MTTALRALGADLDHPEGIAWSDRHGLFAGGEAGQVYHVDLDTGAHEEVANTGGYLLGLAFGPGGLLYVCDKKRRAVLSVDVANGTVLDLTSASGIELLAPNHLVFDSRGTLYVSDSGEWGSASGKIVAVDPEGTVSVFCRSIVDFPNGLAIDPSGAWLYAIESAEPRVSRIALDGERDPEALAEIVLRLPHAVPDGLAFTDTGRLLVSCYRPDTVFEWEPGAEARPIAEDWTGLVLSAPTNLVFAGPGHDRLVTANLASDHLTEIRDSGLVGAPLEYTS